MMTNILDVVLHVLMFALGLYGCGELALVVGGAAVQKAMEHRRKIC